MLTNIWSVTKKELRDYFSSSAALLFLIIFLIAIYIVFFWVDAFFARNLADVRPLFNWIPILFIFLIAALTMHTWSEERCRGAIELILTSAISPWAYLIGKFLAVLGLIAVALLLTSPLPLTVSYLGELDWGPVMGGYIAALFLAAAYVAIGIWASSQTENQIVSLILSIALTGAMYVLGSATVTNLLPYEVGEWLRDFGSGSRFESITRGVLDLRDIFYYITIVIIFLLLTRIKLESLRWSNRFSKKTRQHWTLLTTAVVIALLIFNVGLSFITQARIDLTQGNIYSLSDATKKYLDDLEKPLLIRGYFSSGTHPLLAPLVPRLRDLLSEYAVLGGGNVKVEFIDPLDDAKFEEEAGMNYGIRPVSFHSESKYQASVINTYFNVLIASEDQYEVLNYKDLVELKASANKHEVDLNNPEYQITRAIRTIAAKLNKQVNSFEKLTEPLALTGYVSSRNLLPKNKQKVTNILDELSVKFSQESNDNFDVLYVNPDEDQLTQEYLQNELRVRPISNDDFSTKTYWFYFTLTNGKKTVPLSFSPEADKALVEQAIFSAYKRLLPDSMKTIAFMRPLATPGPAGVSESPGIPKHFSILRKSLEQSVQIIDVDLREGIVPEMVDFLMVFAPRYLNPMQIKAIQNYLTSGGTVLISTSPIDVNVSHFTEVYPVRSGLEGWLEDFGVSIKDTLVLDNQHGKYSLPVMRRAGNLRVRETSLVNYPYVIDVRGDGLNMDVGVTSKLGQLYMPWASPIILDQDKNKNRIVTPLLSSSKNSWVSNSLDIIPDFEMHSDLGFVQPNKIQLSERDTSYLLGVMIEGAFDIESTEADTSRLIVIGSSLLFTDNFSDHMTQILRNEYQQPIQLMQNLVDWSLEDQGLLNILRKHSQFTRTLKTLDEQDKSNWEYLNYGLGVIGLLLIGFIRIILYRKTRRRETKLLQGL